MRYYLQRGEYLRTPIVCTTSETGLEIKVGEREGHGYEIPGTRDFIMKIYSDKAFRKATVDGAPAKKPDLDRKNGIYTVRITEDGKPHKI